MQCTDAMRMFSIAIAMLLASCAGDVAGDESNACLGPSCGPEADTKADTAGTQQFWWIGATSSDPRVFANSGIRATIEVANVPPPGNGCMSYWPSETLDNRYWIQVGYGTCHGVSTPAFTAFYQVWDLGASPSRLLIDGETMLLTEGTHTFSAAVASGTLWQFAIDGEAFGSADLGTATSDDHTPLETVVEKAAGIPNGYTPPAVHVREALTVLRDGAWNASDSAIIYNSAGHSGVAGSAQDPSLGPNEIVTGGDNPHDLPGTVLWQGASQPPAPAQGTTGMPSITTTAPALGSTVSGAVDIAANVANLATGYVYITDDGTTACTVAAPPFHCAWDTTTVADGPHYVTTSVYDANDNLLTWEYAGVVVKNH